MKKEQQKLTQIKGKIHHLGYNKVKKLLIYVEILQNSPFLRGNWLFLKVALDLLFLKLREAAYVHRLTNSNKLVFGSNAICLCTRESHAMYLSRPPDALKSLIRLYVGLRTGYDLGYIAF